MRLNTLYFCIAMLAVAGIQACAVGNFRSNYKDANALIHETQQLQTKPFLKAHLKNGEVFILTDSWVVDTVSNVLTGKGARFSPNRKLLSQGPVSIAIDSIAIYETNKKIKNTETGRVTALGILAGLDVVLGAICLSNPKACFGSCPTFYLNEYDHFHYADAEGFSNAIAPSLEYTDVDALNRHNSHNGTFSLTMKNEALETHCVNALTLLAVPVNTGERVYHSPGNKFYLCENEQPPLRANAPEGDVTALLQAPDRNERFSPADPDNLSNKEEIYLTFDGSKAAQEQGLILHFRQTLMTTYFIYSALGYMGDQVGDIFAQIETKKNAKDKLNGGLKKELGDLDVYVWDEFRQSWILTDGPYETGPIAINKQFIPFYHIQTGSQVRVKLVLNKGLWRLDYAALSHIKRPVVTVAIKPVAVSNKGVPDRAALQALEAPDQYLISMPGDAYKLDFVLPDAGRDYELFLSSKGYYLEWMRAHWIKDKNLWKMKQMIDRPKKYLRAEAARYKKYETTMEQEFWNSRIDTKIFSYEKN